MMPIHLHDEIAAAGISGDWTTPNDPEAIPRSKGAYVLALHLDTPVDISIRRTCHGRLLTGWYLYLGSARGSGGLSARLKRHFRTSKKLHWHVDRLTIQAITMTALAVPGGHECSLVDQLLASKRFTVALAGFGSSDCRHCDSHLLMVADE